MRKHTKYFSGVKHTKYFNGVAIKLLFCGKRKDIVQVGMLQFNSEYTAKRFIKSLTPSF